MGVYVVLVCMKMLACGRLAINMLIYYTVSTSFKTIQAYLNHYYM